MGKPAARLTDMTAHGGTVVGPGVPTVLIGKMPAATILDNHVCPMVTGVVPHVGGPMTLASTGVMIGKKPAGRMGDLKVCVGPPSMVMMGCFTVLIGEVGGGGGGGGAGAAASAAAANVKSPSSIEPFPATEPEPGTEVHHCAFQFTDSAGLPLSGIPYKFQGPDNSEHHGSTGLDGDALHSGFTKAGSFKVTAMVLKDAKWSKDKANLGDEVEMTVTADGFKDGTEGEITVIKRDATGGQYFLARIPCKVQGKKIKGKWKVDVEGNEPPAEDKAARGDEYCCFIAHAGGSVAASGKLDVRSDLEIEVVDEIGQPIAKKPVEVVLANGEVKTLELDDKGKAKVPNVPARPADVGVGKPAVKKPQWPINLKGSLYYNRTWDYNTSTTKKADKMSLASAKVELFIKTPGSASLVSARKTTFLTPSGTFSFTDVPEFEQAAIRIFLEHADRKVVKLLGLSNSVAPDMEIKVGDVPWHQIELDQPKITGLVKNVSLGDIRIKKTDFTYLCDVYMSIRFANQKLKRLVGKEIDLCNVHVPFVGVTHHDKGLLRVAESDYRDRDVILHEYAHFIRLITVPGYESPGYDYNKNRPPSHGTTTLEHYEIAWEEGNATFLSAALCGDAIYRDGYEGPGGDMTHILTNPARLGPHNEASVRAALWNLHVVQKTNFRDYWKAWTDQSLRKVRTIVDFYDNWKELKIKGLSKLIVAFRKFNMEYLYRYPVGSEMFTKVPAPKHFNEAAKEFDTIQSLYDAFSKPLGGDIGGYHEEFYNRNAQFNAGQLAPRSVPINPIPVDGKKYIVPRLFKIS